MDPDILRLTQQALYLVLMLSAPPIIVASVIGLLIALIQAATQIQEQTLQYTAKFFGIVMTLFFTATLIGGALYTFADEIFRNFWNLV